MPDLRFLDAFFLAAAAAFSLAILSDATAVGTETGLASSSGDSQSLSQLDPGASRGVCVVTLAQETLWELLTSHGLASSEKSPPPTLPAWINAPEHSLWWMDCPFLLEKLSLLLAQPLRHSQGW